MPEQVKGTCRHCGKEIFKTSHGMWVNPQGARPYYCGLRHAPNQRHQPRKEEK